MSVIGTEPDIGAQQLGLKYSLTSHTVTRARRTRDGCLRTADSIVQSGRETVEKVCGVFPKMQTTHVVLGIQAIAIIDTPKKWGATVVC